MDVNPISLQMVVPRATDASQVQHNLNQQANVQQEFAMLREQTSVRMKMETVQARDDAEDGRIKDDPERESRNGGQYYRGQKRNREDEPEEEKMAVDIVRGHNIDISL
ncbi:MAG: hypothetical protein IJU05_04720 [Schwartzia sp.]|nr:hypothetical protein [Schwartzia sp. (in: firmicutes)]